MNMLIRADASIRMGTGHVMRCLALAQGWKAVGGAAVLAAAEITPALTARMVAEGIPVLRLAAEDEPSKQARRTTALARGQGADWIVLDGPHFGTTYQRQLKAGGARLLVLDDEGAMGHVCADWVLNQNLHARPELYADREAGTRLLLGPRYALLRQEFWPWRGWRRETPPKVAKILVTLGGSDPDNATLGVIEALAQERLEHAEVTIIIGGSNPHRELLERAVKKAAAPMLLVCSISDMPERMAWADMAVAAAGSTTWELAFMGVPSLLLTLADNQREVAAAVGRSGAAVSLGWHAEVPSGELAAQVRALAADSARRAFMTTQGRTLVDGDGAARGVRRLARPLTLRPARAEDARPLWAWANDPATRAASFTTAPIPWEDHVRWLNARLTDPDCRLLIAQDERGQPVGQVRLDAQGDTAVLSFSVVPERRGQGWAVPLIEQAADECFQRGRARRIRAAVRAENERSRRAFARAGFQEVLGVPSDAPGAVTFVLERNP